MDETRPPSSIKTTLEGSLAAWTLAYELRCVAQVRLARMSWAERLYWSLRGPAELHHQTIGYALDAAVRGNRAQYEHLLSQD